MGRHPAPRHCNVMACPTHLPWIYRSFSDPRVAAKLAGFQLLRANVTANNPDDRALLKRFGLFGPPGTIFFDGRKVEVPRSRVIGFEPATRFLNSLARGVGPAMGPSL